MLVWEGIELTRAADDSEFQKGRTPSQANRVWKNCQAFRDTVESAKSGLLLPFRKGGGAGRGAGAAGK